MLKIIEHITEHGLQNTIDFFELKAKESPDLVSLNYSMINSKAGLQEVNECRGLILNKNDWSVVAYPFYRFYNSHEGHAAELDLSKSKLLEKADGTMICSYWNPISQTRCVSTRGTLFAEGNIGNFDKTFKELFDETVEDMNCYLDNVPKDLNLVFELIGPENRIVTPYKEKGLKLLTARNIKTLEELSNDEMDFLSFNIGIPRPLQHQFNCMEDIKQMFEHISAADEGYVLVEYNGSQERGSFKRIKVKNPRYVALHHLVGAGSDDLLNNKKVVALIQIGEIEEVLAYFPEYASQIQTMKDRFKALAGDLENSYDKIKDIEDRKEFALCAKDLKCPSFYFARRDNKTSSAKEFIDKMNKESLLKMLQ